MSEEDSSLVRSPTSKEKILAAILITIFLGVWIDLMTTPKLHTQKGWFYEVSYLEGREDEHLEIVDYDPWGDYVMILVGNMTSTENYTFWNKHFMLQPRGNVYVDMWYLELYNKDSFYFSRIDRVTYDFLDIPTLHFSEVAQIDVS